MTLRFSIVMPTLDRRAMLLAALASVRAQNWPTVEIIVVDGGSTDGTLEELAKCPDICVLKGPDKGVYDAFNKGIARATGDVIGILNSDDVYEPGTFAAVAEAFATNPDVQSVCGAALLVEDDRILEVFDDEADKVLSSARTSLIGNCITNARFFRRAAMAEIGPFRLDYRYVADRDWLTRWHERGSPIAALARPVYRYRQHSGSLTFRSGRNEYAIRQELLRLARCWRDDPSASADTRTIARRLEGRCLATLAGMDLRALRFGDAARRLFLEKDRWSLAPAVAVLHGAVDWVAQRRRRP
jgi:glycosyltransferase involved in cell wall biosynthesis